MAGVGYYRQVLTVQNPVTSLDSYGQAVVSWVNVGLVRGNLARVDSVEGMGDGGPEMRTTWSIEATWFPDVNMRSRLVWNDNGTDRTLNLRACHDADGRRKRLQMQAIEVQQ